MMGYRTPNIDWIAKEGAAAARALALPGRCGRGLSGAAEDIGLKLGEDLTGGDKNHPMARAQDRQVSVVIFKPVE